MTFFLNYVLVPFVQPSPPLAPPSAEDSFALIIDGLCRAIAARGGRRLIDGPLVILIWTRLRRIARRFATLAARVRAGTGTRTLPARARPRRPVTSRPRPPSPRLPRSFGWAFKADVINNKGIW